MNGKCGKDRLNTCTLTVCCEATPIIVAILSATLVDGDVDEVSNVVCAVCCRAAAAAVPAVVAVVDIAAAVVADLLSSL